MRSGSGAGSCERRRHGETWSVHQPPTHRPVKSSGDFDLAKAPKASSAGEKRLNGQEAAVLC